MQFSSDPPPEAWCQHYLSHHAIDSCGAQVNRIDTYDGVIWFVLAAWSEAKQWCGTEFGLGSFDPGSFEFTDHGPCYPDEGLEIPTDGWPGPEEGTAFVTTTVDWDGNFQPVYWFAGYAYEDGLVGLTANPSTGFAGTSNCENPPQVYPLDSFGAMGFFQDGVAACPAESSASGGNMEPPQQGSESLPDSVYASNAVIVRFTPDVISFPQDRTENPPSFTALLEEATITVLELADVLVELGAVSFQTLAPSWRHLAANPQATIDLHGNPVELIDFTDVYYVRLSGAVAVSEVITALVAMPGIIYVDPDILLSHQTCPQEPYPDDELYEDQWYLNGTPDNCSAYPHGFYDMNVPEAWELCDCCGAGTKIAICDDGVNADHEDLGPYIDVSLSRTFPDPTVPWSVAPYSSHGTKCASLATAATHNDRRGMASIAHLPAHLGDGLLVVLRNHYYPPFPPPDDQTFWSVMAQAMDYICGPIVNRRVGVVSNSMGRAYYKYCYNALPRSAREAFRNVHRIGISHVCSAGNDVAVSGEPCAEPDSAFLYPAAFPDYTLAVAGIDCGGETNPAWFRGSYIDVAGPAVDLWVAGGGTDQYEWREGWIYGGTSAAAPVMAGAIALLLGQEPMLTNEDCYELLKLAADPMDQPSVAVGSGLPQVGIAMSWLTGDCEVVHGFTTEVSLEEPLDGLVVQFRDVEGVNTAEDTWEEFWVVPHRVESVVWLPDDYRTTTVWARGRGTSGWRLISRELDGNPDPTEPPHYDGLYYDHWAHVLGDFEPETGRCVLETYTYKVRVTEDPPLWVWAPFDPSAGECQVQYSFICCAAEGCLDVSEVDDGSAEALGFRVVGIPVERGGQVAFRFVMPCQGRVWLDVYGPDGRLVRGLSSGVDLAAGRSELRWDCCDNGGIPVGSGIYFARFRSLLEADEDAVTSMRVIVVR